MNTGKVKFFDAKKGFGKIIDDSDSSEVFFHFSQVMDDSKILLENEKVEYDITETEKGKNAINLRREFERKVGKIDSFQSGFGFIKTLDSDEKYFVHYTDLEGEGYKKIEDDNEVEFTPAVSEKGLQAKRVVLRDSRSALQKFAFFHDWHQSMEDLSDYAQDEHWCYLKGKTDGYPVLSSYVTYTFKRIQNEDKIEYTSKADGKKYACFNTGLATKKQEELFGYFEHIDNNPHQKPTQESYLKRQSWRFDRFDKESYRLMNHFKQRPKLANYFQNPADLIYDTSKTINS